MPYKVIDVGGKKYAELGENDNAIFVHADGTETPFDADAATSRIAALNGESTGRRHEINQLKQKLVGFEGIEDPEKAKEALATVANLSSGELKTAAQVQEIKDQARIAAEQQVTDAQRKFATDLQEASKKVETLEGQLYEEKIGGMFARSKYVQEKLAIPADIAQNFFGGQFKVEEGKIIGYDNTGGKLYSKARPGELAEGDEAIEMLVVAYPNKEHILKGGGGGSGGTGGNGNTGGLSKEAFAKLDPVARMNVARGHGATNRPTQR